MPYTRDLEYEWQVPAKVIAVIDGQVFLADADLGFDVHRRLYVLVAGIETPRDLPARKEAQRLLHGADLLLTGKRRIGLHWLCDVAYAPTHTPRSEQGSFVAAMLAAGHGIPKE